MTSNSPPLVTAKDALARYGLPEDEAGMVLWAIPPALVLHSVPGKVYCNKDLIPLLEHAFINIHDRGLGPEIRTWDGCFNIRRKRGGSNYSLHSWGLAVDINAAWNRFGKIPTMSDALVKAFEDAGFLWGGRWSKPDGMHFQIARLPGK